MERVRIEKFQGVYYREHATRKYNGKADRCFDISFKLPDGKKVWEKAGWASEGYTAQMAAQVRAERIRSIRHGEELPQKKKNEAKEITFGEVWQKYAAWADTNRKSFKAETNRYEVHIRTILEKLPLSEISPFLLEKIKMDLLGQDYSKQTVKHILVLIRQAINKALVWNLWTGENPIKRVAIPDKLNNKRERFLSRQEADALLAELGRVSPQLKDMALLSLHTGMRAGEIFALRWGNIHFESGIINIADSKSGEAQKVYMTSLVKEMLLGRAKNNPPHELVFRNRKGGQIQEVSDAYERAVKRLKLNEGVTDSRQKVCFHTLRHTFASWLALEGTPILTIKELLRHSSLTMTERYAHLIPDHKRRAILIFEDTTN